MVKGWDIIGALASSESDASGPPVATGPIDVAPRVSPELGDVLSIGWSSYLCNRRIVSAACTSAVLRISALVHPSPTGIILNHLRVLARTPFGHISVHLRLTQLLQGTWIQWIIPDQRGITCHFGRISISSCGILQDSQRMFLARPLAFGSVTHQRSSALHALSVSFLGLWKSRTW